MKPSETGWAGFYLELQRLYQSKTTPSVDRLPQQCHTLSQQIHILARQHPAQLFAQLSLTPPALNLLSARALKQSCLLLIWARLYRWPDNITLQLLDAGFLSWATQLLPPADELKKLTVFPALLSARTFTLPSTVKTILNGCYPQQRKIPLWQCHPLSLVLTFTFELSMQLLPEQKKPQALEEIIARHIERGQCEVKQALLRRLVSIGPALYLTGRFSCDTKQQYGFIIHYQQATCTLLPYDAGTKTLQHEPVTIAAEQLRFLAPKPLINTDWLNNCYNHEPQQMLPVNDVSLKTVLENSVTDDLSYYSFEAQCAALQQQPVLCQYILDYATQLNRQQLPVKQLRHALSLVGQDMLPMLLATAELHQYCIELAQPYHLLLWQFRLTLQQSLLIFSDTTSFKLTPPEAALVATIFCLPLWQSPTLYHLAPAQQHQTGTVIGQHCIKLLQQQFQQPESLQQLLIHYDLPLWADAVLLLHRSRSSEVVTPDARLRSLLLQCALYYSGWLFFDYTHPEAGNKLLQQTTLHLKLPHKSHHQWLQQLLSCNTGYIPLSPLL